MLVVEVVTAIPRLIVGMEDEKSVITTSFLRSIFFKNIAGMCVWDE